MSTSDISCTETMAPDSVAETICNPTGTSSEELMNESKSNMRPL